jgi:phosphoglycolate phosphatase-like HAD superfamily hydrolase
VTSTPKNGWLDADAFLFDIDGTLLNSRDGVHYNAFHAGLREVFGVTTKIDDVPVHGNTDPGIVRAMLAHAGRDPAEFDRGIRRAMEIMCAEAASNASSMAPETCPSVVDLLALLQNRGKLMGVTSGNLERIGWLKLEASGLRPFFAFGVFSDEREQRAEIFRAGIAEARRLLGRSEARVVIVGDTPADIRAAQEIGAPIIAVATGIFPLQELLKLVPDACFGCCTDLLAAV